MHYQIKQSVKYFSNNPTFEYFQCCIQIFRDNNIEKKKINNKHKITNKKLLPTYLSTINELSFCLEIIIELLLYN